MNLSMQMVRGLGALAMCAAASAYALTQPTAVARKHEAVVAHTRLEIVVVSGAENTPRYKVASIRVGEPVPLAPEQTRRVVMRTRISDTRS